MESDTSDIVTIFKEDGVYYIKISLDNYPPMITTLVWLIFGSATSLDCDIIVGVPVEFTRCNNLGSPVFNKICEVLDKILGPIIGTDKEINSSLGYWDDGIIQWCQKSSDIAEVNNSLMATFDSHIQMYSACPITRSLERNVTQKIHSSIRNVLCKMARAALKNNENSDALVAIILGVLNIPEIRRSTDLKAFIDAIFCGITITKPRQTDIVGLDKDANVCIYQLNKSREARNKVSREFMANIKKDLPIEPSVRQMLALNSHEIVLTNAIIDQLQILITAKTEGSINEIVAELKKSINDFTISFNRIVRNMRRKQEIGIRIDLLRLVDFRNIILTKNPLERFKNIAFQLGQTMALMDGVELYDKIRIAERYPELGVFLRREVPSDDDLGRLNDFIKMFLDRISGIPEITRTSCEHMRFK